MSVAQSLEKQVSNNTNFTINHNGIKYFPNLHICCEDKKPCCKDIFSEVVEETYKSTRVYVFFGRIFDLIELMTKLQMRKLLDTREYVIIYIDLEAYSESASYRYFWLFRQWRYSDRRHVSTTDMLQPSHLQSLEKESMHHRKTALLDIHSHLPEKSQSSTRYDNAA
ncbi:hypothetical protein AVEN_77037-1 [Araneus ventricosus]|uniref:Uncharacterized protein n=1 Tax=Araneus ventricosus TaxID=182803 RepID=A0A4Y2G4P9_ARAVE|nr:hypothetical protein AVEN_77037-1 [Araneus ventricosus]